MKELFERYGITMSDWQKEQLKEYYRVLIKENEKMNLTSITDRDEVIRKHFLDSALIMQSDVWRQKEQAEVLDVGSGAGFPGMVLAVLNPKMKFILLDSLKKRVDFLDELVIEINVNNVIPYHGRAESYGRDEVFRNHFDFVVSRAVAELPVLLEYCIPFVKKGGYFVSYKGRRAEEELQQSGCALEVLGAEIDHIEQYELNEGEERNLIYIMNKSVTNKKYPRRVGKPKKKPL